ncbi:MAG TPA: dinitrogenase iron-molybdenum cofactor biosynthesis protein [Sulfurospirillum sp. UBA12182]|jgi:predicted Fe-Mo cluster-binding NifX family protein|nr:MAG TPA: dinitrogenase iron-molybdenum cofactor biosynthesis protein [Sulfurospirillum sp. UBA12182]
MIAIPLDNKDATTISTLYGQAPYFALLDEVGGSFTVLENSACGNGVKGVEFLKSKGIDGTVFYHMGEGLYKMYAQDGVSVFSVQKELMSLDKIFLSLQKEELVKLDKSNYKELLDAGVCESKCGC